MNVCECVTLKLKSFYSRKATERGRIMTTQKTTQKTTTTTIATPVNNLQSIESVVSRFAHFAKVSATYDYANMLITYYNKRYKVISEKQDTDAYIQGLELNKLYSKLESCKEKADAAYEEWKTLETLQSEFNRLPRGLQNRIKINALRSVAKNDFSKLCDFVDKETLQSLYKAITDYTQVELKAGRIPDTDDERQQRAAKVVQSNYQNVKKQLDAVIMDAFKIPENEFCEKSTIGFNSTLTDALIDSLHNKVTIKDSKGNESLEKTIVSFTTFAHLLYTCMYARLNKLSYNVVIKK